MGLQRVGGPWGRESKKLPLALQVNSVTIFRLVLSFLLRTTECLDQPGYEEGAVGTGVGPDHLTRGKNISRVQTALRHLKLP